MSTRTHLIALARTFRTDDADAAQLIRDLAAELVKLSPTPTVVNTDEQWTPGDATRQALIAAALTHSDEVGLAAYFVGIPNTSPEMVVALCQRDHLQHALGEALGAY